MKPSRNRHASPCPDAAADTTGPGEPRCRVSAVVSSVRGANRVVSVDVTIAPLPAARVLVLARLACCGLVLSAASLVAAPAAAAAPDETADLQKQLAELQDQLRHLQRTGELPATAPVPASESLASATQTTEDADDDDSASLVLPEWHVNLSDTQRKLLMRAIAPIEFDAADAPKPEDTLAAFRAAVKQSDDFDDIVPFLDRKRRRRYLISEGHPAYAAHKKPDAEWIAPLEAFVGSIVRVERTLLNPDRDDRAQVLAWMKKGTSYGLYRIEFHGEGRLWRMAGFKLERTARFLPEATPEEAVGPGQMNGEQPVGPLAD